MDARSISGNKAILFTRLEIQDDIQFTNDG
jgi:hypothetical protein